MTSSQLYILVESRYFLQGHTRTSFGVALIETGDTEDTVLQTVCDLSPDRRHVLEFVELCNRLQPTKDQLPDLLEEFLG